MIKYPKGSEWSRWDLHCHTPDDRFWVNKPDTQKARDNFAMEYIKKAKENELKVIAITNHFEYNKITESYYPKIKEEGEKEGIIVLPGVEITANEGNGIHILAIFSETLNDLSIIDDLMTKIYPIKGKQKETTEGVPLCENNLKEIYKKFSSALVEDFILIFAHANTAGGVISNATIQGGPRVQAWKYKFMRFAQWTKNPYSFNEGGFNDRVIKNQELHYEREREMIHIVASDCRSLTPISDQSDITYLGEKYVWIKANPSFEGLKQVFYDSEGKIAYQESDPRKTNKQFFSSIKLGDINLFDGGRARFSADTFPLNTDMIAIIGSRGSGKSLLIDVFAKLHNKISKYNENVDKICLDQNFLIEYQKEPDSIIVSTSENINELDYIHVHQSEFKQICMKPIELDKEIRMLLGIPLFEYSIKSNEEIDDLVNKYFDIRDWFQEEEESKQLKHSEQYNKEQIKKFEKKIDFIRTSQSQEHIENFRKSQSKKLKLENKLSEIEKLKIDFEDILNRLNPIINNINESISADFKLKIPLTNFNDQIDALNKYVPYLKKEIEKITAEIKKSKRHFQEVGIDDVDYVMDQVKIYDDSISKHKKTLEKIEKYRHLQLEVFPTLQNIVNDMETSIEEYKEIINKKWKDLKEKEFINPEQRKIHLNLLENIEIVPEIYFDENSFYDLIIEFLNKNKFRKRGNLTQIDRLKDLFNVYDYNSYISLVKNEEIITLEDSEISLSDFLKKTEFFNNEMDREFFKSLYKSHTLQKFCKVISRTKINDRNIESLSMGERGTLFLRIKLATAAFSLPFLFDQPEDDLDNDFIQNFLVPLFRQLKKYRQIIVATHNANIVVNSNAEQIIIAKNENEQLLYQSGGLEEPAIRTQICEILEGGEEAFQKRASKYGLK